MATILPPVGEILEPGKLDAAVDSAGFQLLWTEYEVLGELDGGEGLELFALDTEQRFMLLPGQQGPERESFERLMEWADAAGQLLRVRGRVRSGDAATPQLTVQEYSME